MHISASLGVWEGVKCRAVSDWRSRHPDDSNVILDNPLLLSVIERWIDSGAPASKLRRDIPGGGWKAGRGFAFLLFRRQAQLRFYRELYETERDHTANALETERKLQQKQR